MRFKVVFKTQNVCVYFPKLESVVPGPLGTNT